MIPKKIHYCWFGTNPKSKIFEECLNSWKLYCPDFEIIEWNEQNSKKYTNVFYKNALRKKKYAFVADYIRTKVLYEHGGVYLDTDMLLLKPIDNLLHNVFFSAEEFKGRVAYGLFGAVPNHRFLEKMINFYDKTEFNSFSPPVITHTFSPFINKKNCINGEIILDIEAFYPLSYQNRELDYKLFVKPQSYAVHLWDHSWANDEVQGMATLLSKLKEVVIDFLFYGYSFSYFKRYGKEFSRKIYHQFIAK